MKPHADIARDRRQALAKLLALGLCAAGGTVATSAAHAHPGPAPCEPPARLRLAVIPKTSDDVQLEAYRMLARALAGALALPVEVVPAASYSAVVQGLQAGRIDVAELGPATYVQMQRTGAVALPFAALVNTPGTLSRYQALLVVRRGARWRRWQDLRGATLGLVDPASTSGALLPRQLVRAHTGMELEEYFARVSYAGSHDRALAAVRDGLVDAAFISSERLTLAHERKLVAPEELRTLWTSAPLPTDAFVMRKRLCPALQAQLLQVFVQQQALLRPALQKLGKQGVVAVDEGDYAEVERMLGLSVP
ncbi:phosphate/phosphite/phosphonate ABC transporter substrate-binding protein [Comamonas endophytica]|uniref:Phosphate/phosphite/phosphonate ABC transporter substrate-binding protein n=1 Tax=Comamonas endophytica TaxID=2949090 RepID=A0ABY6GA49_9BURK|nr:MULTISPECIES: phosphate/phosphite/phosphonate ABC transporter substrate-binding protein [unclassified Acidovorax]MCD2511992.1 phosphate/phosphite/phosphonate ABC transporter substrate-binding protein [Acidovorax sp. D4N7]UYG51771.1 phosphate/phosphite/phosphonate ABC transporter substrate-binding protein [Acidovorax sp. 5MLIR]